MPRGVVSRVARPSRFSNERCGRSHMQSFRVMVVAVMAGAAIPVLAATAHATPGGGIPAGTSAAQCVRGCNAQKKTCIQAARTIALACKLDCRQNTVPNQLGTCMKACATTFRGSKDMCRTVKKDCIAGCRPPAPVGGAPSVDASCLGTCGTDLAECAQGVITPAKACVRGCRSAPDRLMCLQGCAATAAMGGEACASDFETCGTSCASPAP